MEGTKTVLWPFQPGDADSKQAESMKNFLSLLSQSMKLVIQPVSIMSADFYGTSQYFEAIDHSAFKSQLKKDCEEYLENFAEIDKNEVVVLENYFGSQSGEVAQLASYVNDSQPDFVLMNSHGRKGWSRAFLGSFTESFLLESSVPVFVLGPHCSQFKSLKSALMPLELSESSQSFLEKFLDHHAVEFIEKLILFHKISMIDLEDVAWAPSIYGLGGVGAIDIQKKALEQAHSYFKAFLEHPLSKKRLSYQISEKLDGLISVIQEQIEKTQCDLLIMRSESGILSANVLGSMTRQVIRDSQVPVLVYPHSCKKIN